MIITNIVGGLGNQMFQYAIGRYLAKKNNTILKLDTESFDNYKIHSYSLNKLNIIENISDKSENKKFKDRKYFNLINKSNKKHIKEKYFHFNPQILNLPDNVYLEGYWQSEKYFNSIKNILQREFSPICRIQGQNNVILDKIQSCNAVSLHVRRGDYTNPENEAIHGLCGINYYSRAMDYIVKRVETPIFFVFSDDVKWVKQNLSIPHATFFITWNDKNESYWDMFLMRQCKHNIIANSSFSWWAAWLNNNSDKIVIAPQKWFNSLVYNDSDLIPKSWVRL